MYLVKILVDDYEHAEGICELLADAEDEGFLDFSFGVKITEDMPEDGARRCFIND